MKVEDIINAMRDLLCGNFLSVEEIIVFCGCNKENAREILDAVNAIKNRNVEYGKPKSKKLL